MRSSCVVLAVLCVAACERRVDRATAGDGAVHTTSATVEGAPAAPTIVVNPPPAPIVNVTIAMPGASAGAAMVTTTVTPSPSASVAPGGGAVLVVSPSGRPAIVSADGGGGAATP